MDVGGASRPQCSICYEALRPETTNALLCGHTFHEACITKWLGEYERRTCPFCGLRCEKDHLVKVRFNIPDNEEEPTGPSNVVDQSAVDRLASLRRRKEEVPSMRDADRELIELHDAEDFGATGLPNFSSARLLRTASRS